MKPTLSLPSLSITLHNYYTFILKIFQYDLNDINLDSKDVNQIWYHEIERQYFDIYSEDSKVKYKYYNILHEEYKAVFRQTLENNKFHIIYSDILDNSIRSELSENQIVIKLKPGNGLNSQTPLVCDEIYEDTEKLKLSIYNWTSYHKRRSSLFKRSSIRKTRTKKKQCKYKSNLPPIPIKSKIRDLSLGFVVDMKLKLKRKRLAIKNELNMIKTDIPVIFKQFDKRKYDALNYIGFVDNNFILNLIQLYNKKSLDNISGSLNNYDFLNCTKLLNYIRIHIPTVIISGSYDKVTNMIKLCGFLESYQVYINIL